MKPFKNTSLLWGCSLLLAFSLGFEGFGQEVINPSPPKVLENAKLPDLGLERLLRRELGPFYNRNNFQIMTRWASYRYLLLDLLGDQTPEALLYLQSPHLCEEGQCQFLIFSKQNQDWKMIHSFPSVSLPLYFKPATPKTTTQLVFQTQNTLKEFQSVDGRIELKQTINPQLAPAWQDGFQTILNTGPDFPIPPR